MSLLDRLFGASPPSQQPGEPAKQPPLTDEQSLQRYRYLLRTAPPEAIEQVHAEAFAQLTPEQRAQVLKELSRELPPSERTGMSTQPDPQSLARLATRAEMRQPGTMERAFGGGGLGMGGVFGSSLLGSIAGSVIGSAIAHQLFGGFHGFGGMDSGAIASADTSNAEASDDADDAGDDSGDDTADDGGDFGDSGGDGGGDFGDV
ncbi:MAG TPA: hypothetical protein VEM39_09390 [Myxococcaceae bacterium]|nr:hypothetical protein [Myxococcaceae bacterium]